MDVGVPLLAECGVGAPASASGVLGVEDKTIEVATEAGERDAAGSPAKVALTDVVEWWPHVSGEVSVG